MKIVINALSARMGGGQTYIKNLLAHLPKDDDIEILVFAQPSLVLPEDTRIRRGIIKWPVRNPIARMLWERFALSRLLIDERADVLFCPGGVVSTKTSAHCRVITMFRNMTPFDVVALKSIPWGLQLLRNKLLKRVMLSSMRDADLTIFISAYARKVIEKYIRIPSAVTIPHGINEIFRTDNLSMERPAELPLGSYMLYVSKFESYKHHYEVVSGYSLLPPEVRREHKLVLVGETDHPNVNLVRDLIRRHDLDGQVFILGAIPYDRLPAFYANANVLIFASSCENCPNILLEGLASGRPMMSSNVMPMPEFGGAGIEYFSPFDPLQIAQSMSKMLLDFDLAAFSARAALIESRKFSWDVCAQLTWNAIRNSSPRVERVDL